MYTITSKIKSGKYFLRWFALSLCVVALALMSGCSPSMAALAFMYGGNPPYVQVTEEREYSFKMASSEDAPRPAVVVQSMPGDLQIQQGDKGVITVFAERVSTGLSEEAAQSNLAGLVFNVQQEDNTIMITADYDWAVLKNGEVWVNYQLVVPEGTDINISLEKYAPPQPDNLSYIYVIGGMLLALLVIIGFLGIQLHEARSLIRKLEFELNAARGDVHMRKLEREWHGKPER